MEKINNNLSARRMFIIGLLALSVSPSFSQTAVTGAQLDTITAGSGNTYAALRAPGANTGNLSNAGNYTYTFGNVSSFTDNAKKLRAFTAGGSGYTYNVGVPITIKIRRVENASITDYRNTYGVSGTVPVPTPRDLAYFEGLVNNTTGTVQIKSAYIPKMEDLFATNDVTIGIDNIFANTTATNFNNIERIDVIAAGGISVPTPSAQGFGLFERGAYNGHDPAKVALITSLDGSGNPLTYAPAIVQIQGTDYSFAGQTTNAVYQPSNSATGNFIVLRRDSATGNLQASDMIGGGQGIGGVLIKYADFGIAANTTVYGYSVLANDFPGTGADVVNYTNTTNFPTNSSDVTGVAGNDMATVTGVVKLLTIAGNVYNDANGLKDNLVNGSNINNPSGTQLYVNLVNASGIVVGTASVQSDGSFLFDKLEFGPLTAQLSTIAGTLGNTAPAISLPAGWANTGEAFGINNNSGTGNEAAAAANGFIAVKIGDQNITTIKFGIDSLPKADPKTVLPQANPGGSVRVAVPVLTGSDHEDGVYTGVTLNNTIRINTLPVNGTLYYNGNAVTAGQVIPNYSPALLAVDPNAGLVTVSFTYSQIDAAGLAGSPATVTIPFTVVVPVGLLSFSAQKANADQDALLLWTSNAEINFAYYDIERSVNGADFISLGRVSPDATPGLIHTYSFTDANTVTGQNIYRLKMVDIDGRNSLSEFRTLSFGKKHIIVLSPNPAHEYTVLKGAEKGMTAVILDAEGKSIKRYNISDNNFRLPLNQIAAGMYFIQIFDRFGTLISKQQLIKY